MPDVHPWQTRLVLGLAAGLAIVSIDNFAFSGEVSPLVIVALLLAVTFAEGVRWASSGWLAAVGTWVGVPSAHLVKHVFHRPDTLHPNTYASILMRAAFTFVVATIGLGGGALGRKLARGQIAGSGTLGP